MERLYLVDTTLRDGEQTAGVRFTIREKVNIAKMLDELGVDIIEAGIPVMGKEEFRAVERILDLSLRADILTWNRMKLEDIKASVEAGAKNIHISVPSSDIHIYKKLQMNREEVLDQMRRVVSYAREKECSVSIGAEDASRADEGFLIKLFKESIKLGVSRVRYADTVSVLTPFTTFDRINNIKSKINVPIDFHGHNDFGLGTGNAIGAFKAGAHYISCSVNGLGERAGNTPLEEIVLALKYMENCKSPINVKNIMRISRVVEKYSGRTLHKSKPIVGEAVFSHEAGIHVDGLLKDKSTYEYLVPTILGRKHKIVKGKHSGKSYLKIKHLNII